MYFGNVPAYIPPLTYGLLFTVYIFIFYCARGEQMGNVQELKITTKIHPPSHRTVKFSKPFGQNVKLTVKTNPILCS